MQDYSYKELLFFWVIVTHVRNFCLFCFCLHKKIPLPTPSYPTYLMQGGSRHPEWGPSHLKNCTMGETYLREPVPGATYQGLAPAGSRDSLRMTALAIRKAKGRKRGLIFLGLHRKPIKPMTLDLLCSRRPQAPSRWGEDAGRPFPEDARRLPDWVLEALGDKWTQRAPVLQGVILKKKREREKRKNDTGRPSFGEQGP